MEKRRFSLRNRWHSFGYALNGIREMMGHEHSAWLHSIIAVCTVVAGFLLDISKMEWVAVVIVIGAVLATEAINTAIERMGDLVSPEFSKDMKCIKDLAAGGVLLMAIAAAVVGGIIFFPKLASFVHIYD